MESSSRILRSGGGGARGASLLVPSLAFVPEPQLLPDYATALVRTEGISCRPRSARHNCHLGAALSRLG